MRVRTIDINGAKRVDASEILKKSDIDVNSPLIFIDTLKIKKIIIEQIPLVKEVYIDRNFPNRILINVVERTPRFAVFNFNKYYMVDEEGFLIDVLEKKPSKEFLVIEYFGKLENVEVGKKLEFMSMYNYAFFRKIDDLDVSEKKKIKNFVVDSKGISIIFNSGLIVFLGNDDKFLHKLKLLPYIYKAAREEKINISKIDINHLEVPYIISKSE